MTKDDEKQSLVTLNGSKMNNSVQYFGTSDRLPDGKTSILGATFIISNAALGAGLLTVPYAFFNTGGPWVGLAVETVRLHDVSYVHPVNLAIICMYG